MYDNISRADYTSLIVYLVSQHRSMTLGIILFISTIVAVQLSVTSIDHL